MRRLISVIALSFTLAGAMVAAAQAKPEPPVVLSDFTICTPRSALATKPEWGRWQVVAYEADGVAGKMIGAKSLIAPPNVTLPLNAKGWHRMYVGYWNPYFEYDGEMVLRLKLTGDPCFGRILAENPKPGEAEQVHPGRTSIVERFWRAEDLTGRALTIGKFKGRKAYVAYVKLVPMTPEEVAGVQMERQRKRARRVVASIDGAGIWRRFYGNTPTAEDLREMVEEYRDSDVGTIIWAFTYGDKTNYRSEFGLLEAARPETMMKDTGYSRAINPPQTALLEKGIVYHDVIAKQLHSMGIKFDVMIRPSLQYESPINTDRKGFVAEHREFRIRHASGSPVEKLSWAYPEVRGFTLSLIREIAERFDIDGVNIAFVRLNLCMGWEKPVADAFRAKGYTDKLHNVGANDPRIRKIRAEFLLQFMRDTRKLLDEVGGKKGKRLQLSAWVWPENHRSTHSSYFDVDYRAMMKEGLLDSIIMHDASTADEEDTAIARANGCKYYLAPLGGFDMVLEGYEKGMDGMAYWDIDGRAANYGWWRHFKVAGDPQKLKESLAAPPPAPERRLITIRKINGMSVSGKDLWQSCYAGG